MLQRCQNEINYNEPAKNYFPKVTWQRFPERSTADPEDWSASTAMRAECRADSVLKRRSMPTASEKGQVPGLREPGLHRAASRLGDH